MKKLASAIALALVFANQTAIFAQADSTDGLQNAVGLIVEYRDGVPPVAPDGQVTGQNFAGVHLANTHDVGSGFTAVEFDTATTDTEANNIATNLRRDPRVLQVVVDHDFSITPQSLEVSAKNKLALALGTVFKPASSPLSPRVVDAWNSSAPYAPQIKVSWAAPKVLNGGRLAGYQVWKSVNGGAYSVATTISNPKVHSFTLSLGLTAGAATRVYVKAITKLGLAIKYGLPTKAVSVTPTTRPVAPTLTGYADSALNKPQWSALTLSQRGGLPVTFQVSATAPGKPTLTCTTTSTTCLLPSFSSDSQYSISVSARNSRGTSTSASVIRARDPYFYQQWYLFGPFGINAPQAWAQMPATYANPVVVAVIDTGFTSHSDLNPQVVPGYDFVSTDQVSNDGDGWDPDASDPGSFNSNPTSKSSWHGTHVAGLIGAAANGIGIIGVAPGVKLQSVRALGGNGGKASDLLAAITWASGGTVNGVPNNPTPAKVINISMGTETASTCDAGVEAAYQAALGRGVTIVTSAGNGDSNNQPMQAFESYPGNCLGSINVGATGATGDASYFSNYGLGVDISAPGGDDRVTTGTQPDAAGMMISTLNDGTRSPGAESYAFDEGTSMAAPMVSGAAALLYAKSASMTPELVWQYLSSSVRKFRPGTECALTVGTDSQRCGAGILDVNAALKLVK